MKLDFHDFPGMIKLDPEIRPPASSSQLPALIPDLDLDVAAQLLPCLGIVVDVEPKHQPQERTRTLPSGNHQTWHWKSLHFSMSVP